MAIEVKLSDDDDSITISFEPLEKLRMHEEVIEHSLEKLVARIQRERVLKNPVIADSSSKTVIDGNHRVEALRRLGAKYAPVQLVEYHSSSIVVERWFRAFAFNDLSSLKRALRRVLKSWGIFEETSVEEALKKLEQRSASIAILTREQGFVVGKAVTKSLPAYRKAQLLEEELEALGGKKTYEMESVALEMLKGGVLVVALPPITKEEVVEASTLGKLYPPKSTRHVVPLRVLGLNIPLEWLNIERKDLLLDKLRNHLQKGRFRKMPPRTKINGRLYTERVVIFEVNKECL
ncbi:MAG: ParB N-terminal domain-containing protein [Candidatus Verstraetearchaeota archaeon]|nr:ParB N-terminal domain-containing protein [Candidatus Verstraetearchaeota archaeon]